MKKERREKVVGSTVRLTTAQALVKFLNNQYVSYDGKEHRFVEGIFNIFGHGNVVGLGQALETDSGDLKIIQGKNEQGMAHAAIAYSKQLLRRKIFAVTSSVGPGSANLTTAAGTALANNIPVLFLPGDTFATRQPDPVLQQVEQEQSIAITTNDALKPLSRYWDRIDRPEKLMSAMIRAFEVMTNPATAGPVTICLPQDVQGEAYEFDEVFFEKRVHYIDRQTPSQRSVDIAVEAIKSSKKPIIIVGGGAKYSGAREELMLLSKTHGIPLVETQAGKSTVEEGFEYQLGGIGVTGISSANKAAKEADLIIGIGTRYTDFTTASKTAFDFENSKFININVSRLQAYKMDAVQVVGDAKLTVKILLSHLGGYKSEFPERIKELKEEWKKERIRLSNITFTKKNFNPEIQDEFGQETLNEYSEILQTEFPQTNAVIAVNEAIKADSIVVGAAGSLPGDMQRIWNSKEPNTYHMEYGYSTMGYEIAGALGVKFAEPNKEVYAMVGDGSFLMLHTELLTSIQYGQKINLVLFDNSGFGCINNLQMANGGESLCTEFRDVNNTILNVDYAKIAEGYGAKVYKVKTGYELREALKDAEKSTISTLIEIKVLPKTMTDGYGSWWNVGVSEVSTKEQIQEAFKTKVEKLKEAKKY